MEVCLVSTQNKKLLLQEAKQKNWNVFRQGEDFLFVEIENGEHGFQCYFAEQVLINPKAIPKLSIQSTAQRIYDQFSLREENEVLVQIFGPPGKSGERLRQRHELLRSGILKSGRPVSGFEVQNKNQSRNQMRSFVKDGELVNVSSHFVGYMMEEGELWCSMNKVSDPRYWSVVRRGLAEEIRFPESKSPSLAFQKLYEAQWLSDHWIQRRNHCVDLGASPGGWTQLAVAQGATVVSVDRSALELDAEAMKSVEFIKGDAFKYEPNGPVDWLLCDVIAYPEKTIELLKLWLDSKWCRNFCVTLKFQGEPHLMELIRFERELIERNLKFSMRRLASNKNELTVFGENSRIDS